MEMLSSNRGRNGLVGSDTTRMQLNIRIDASCYWPLRIIKLKIKIKIKPKIIMLLFAFILIFVSILFFSPLPLSRIVSIPPPGRRLGIDKKQPRSSSQQNSIHLFFLQFGIGIEFALTIWTPFL